MKHPYAEQIHAFADGKAIQCRKRTTADNAPWEDIAKPSWLRDFEYRVKPVTVHALSDDVSIALLKKVGRLTKANADLHHELSEKEAEIDQLNGIIKCIDNSSIKLSKESRQYRQTNAYLHNEIEHLKKQNEHLQCKSLKLGRYFINQPSTLQPLHYLDGVDVLAYEECPGTFRIYSLSGAFISMQVPSFCLSQGWSSARTSRICNYE